MISLKQENQVCGQLCHFFVFLRGGIKLPAPYYQMFISKNKIVRRKTTRIILSFELINELKSVLGLLISALICVIYAHGVFWSAERLFFLRLI